MLLQVIGLWSIVAIIVVWFIRDEQRRRDALERELAVSYAQGPRRKLAFEKSDAPVAASMWRDQPAAMPLPRDLQTVPAPTPMPTPVRQPVMSEAQLKFIAMLAQPQQAQLQD